MTLKRLTPVIHRYDVGYVRMWRDELAEIVRLMRQLDGAEVRIEADDFLIGDIDADLPDVGSRVKSFKATASRTTAGPPVTLVEVRLSRDSCEIEATDPDLTTLGAIDAITKLADRCRRIPRWAGRLFRIRDPTVWRSLIVFPMGIALTALLVSFVAAGLITSAVRHSSKSPLPIPVDVAVVAVGGLAFFITFFCSLRARTVLYTGTRAEAPTFWQRHRADIAINIAVGVFFYLLGLLTTHP